MPLQLSQAAAMARLGDIRAQLARHSKAESMRALQELADAAPGTAAAARACNWLGALARADHDDALAAEFYGRAYASQDRSAQVLAARGLGDLALDGGRYGSAYALYGEARNKADGESLRAELDQKLALAQRRHRRQCWEYGAWAFIIATIGWFVARIRWRGQALVVPIELLYALPLYALFIVACMGRDPKVFHALWLTALWSLALIAAAGLATRRHEHMTRPVVLFQTGLIMSSTIALFFAVCNRAGIVDSLLFTVAL